MERDLFARRLANASVAALDFARTFIVEPLPAAMRFHIELNASHDGNAGPEFKLYPEDSERSPIVDASAEDVIALLWRDGRVPQWIDVSVVGEAGDTTTMGLLVCGRFIADETRLYYTWNKDVAPFGVKGPSLPFDYEEGRKFSLHSGAHFTGLKR